MDEIEGVKLLLFAARWLAVYYYTLLSGAKTNLEQLEDEVKLLKAFRIDAVKDERFKVLEKPIVDVIHEAEDAIARCAAHAHAEKYRSFLGRTFGCISQKNIRLAEMVKSIREDKIRPLFDKAKIDFATITVNRPPVVPEDTASARVQVTIFSLSIRWAIDLSEYVS